MNHDPAQQGSLTFLGTELGTGRTLASIAETATDPEKISRNWKNAKRAYFSVIRFMDQVDLSETESREICAKLKELEHRWQALGSMVASS